jgi:hypothetical protein
VLDIYIYIYNTYFKSMLHKILKHTISSKRGTGEFSPEFIKVVARVINVSLHLTTITGVNYNMSRRRTR